MSGRPVGSNRTLLIIIGGLVLVVAGLTVALLTRGGSDESAQPVTTFATASTSVSASISTLSSLVPVGTITLNETPSAMGSDPTMSTIGAGSTDPADFAERVATALLSYDWRTDFEARSDDVFQLAAPTPYGDWPGLLDDIISFTPTGAALSSIQQQGSSVKLGSVQVQESEWGRQRLIANGAPAGAHGMEVSGIQTFTEAGQASTSAPVTISMVVVCPPTTEVCALTRIYPGRLQDALGG